MFYTQAQEALPSPRTPSSLTSKRCLDMQGDGDWKSTWIFCTHCHHSHSNHWKALPSLWASTLGRRLYTIFHESNASVLDIVIPMSTGESHSELHWFRASCTSYMKFISGTAENPWLWGQTISPILLNEHTTKLSAKHLPLHSQISASFSPYQRHFLLHKKWLIQRLTICLSIENKGLWGPQS